MHPQVFIRAAILVISVALATAQQCNYDISDGYIIDVNNSEKNGAIFMSNVDSATREDCQSACCNREKDVLEDGTIAVCNLAVFHDKDKAQKKSKSCFLVFCPSEDSCRLLRVNEFSSSFVAQIAMDTTTDYEVSIRKPPSPKFYHPDGPPINFHKLFRRSHHAKGESSAVNEESMKEAEMVLTAAETLLDVKAEAETNEVNTQMAIEEGDVLSLLADAALKAAGGEAVTDKPATPEATVQTSNKDKKKLKPKKPTITTTPNIIEEKKLQQTPTAASTTSPTTASTIKTTESTSRLTQTQSSQSTPDLVTATALKTTLRSQTEVTGSSAQTTKEQVTTDGPTTLLPSTLSSATTNPATSPLLAKSTPSGNETPSLVLSSTPAGTPSTQLPSSRSPGSTVTQPLTTPSTESPASGSAVHTSSMPSAFPSPNSASDTQPSTLGVLKAQSHNATQSPPQSFSTVQTLTLQSNTLGALPSQSVSSQSSPQPLSSAIVHYSPSHNASDLQPPPGNQSDSTPSSPLSAVTTSPTTQHLPVTTHNVEDATLSTTQGTESTQSSTLLPEKDLTPPAIAGKTTPTPKLASAFKSTPSLMPTSPSQTTPSIPTSNSSNQVSPSTLDPLRRNLESNHTKMANDTAASVDTSDDGQDVATSGIIASNGALIAAVCFGILFLLAVLVVLSNRWYEAYQRRHYSKVDYLINGMYK